MPRNCSRHALPRFKARIWVISLILAFLDQEYAFSAQGLQSRPSAKSGIASFYGQEACRWNPNSRCPTASGQSLYDLEAQGIRYAAAWDYPFGTRLQVCRQDDPTHCTQVVILDRGPAKRLHRLIDLNATSFAELAPLTDGVVKVTVEGRGWAD